MYRVVAFLIFLSMLTQNTAKAQTEMGVSKSYMGLGLGLESSIGLGGGASLRATYESGVADIGSGTVTFGGEISSGFNFSTNLHTMIGLRSAWYLNTGMLNFHESDKFNVYAGGSLGLSHYTNTIRYDFTSRRPYTSPYLNIMIGANYFFKEDMAFFIEQHSGFPASFTYFGIQL